MIDEHLRLSAVIEQLQQERDEAVSRAEQLREVLKSALEVIEHDSCHIGCGFDKSLCDECLVAEVLGDIDKALKEV